MSYPEFVEETIGEIVQITGRPEVDIRSIFIEILNGPKVKKINFVSDDDRYHTCIRMLKVQTVMRAPEEEATVVPLGCGGIQLTKKGEFMDKVYAIMKFGTKKSELRMMMCMRDLSKLPEHITYYARYNEKVQIGRDGMLFASDATTFAEPTMMSKTPEQIWDSLKIRKVTILEAQYDKNLSRKRSDGYVDDLDLRLISAMVGRANSFKRKDGTPAMVYTIIDDTVDFTEQTDRRFGHGFTVWAPNSLPEYPRMSECWFLGSLQKGDDGQISMNAIYIHPIYAFSEA